MSGSNPYTATYAQDVVAVFDNAFNQIFINARPMKASIKETAKVMKHPVESGATVTDHKIILSIAIELPVTLTPQDYVNTYHEIKSIFVGNNTIQVQTNTGLYQSMVLHEMPHEENPEHYDTITMNLKLEQFIIVATKTSAIATKSGGNKTGKAATPTQQANANEKASKGSAFYSLTFGRGKD